MSTDSTSEPPEESPGDPNTTPEDVSAPVLGEAAVFPVGHMLSGKYRVEGVLGRGGMGVVHAGRQLELDRPVAIKCLRRTPGQGERSAQRFAREARAIAKMRSEHVVRVFDVGVEDGLPFIVMEHLAGRDLAAELENGPLSPEDTAKYLLQACEAIAEAHSFGIVHRDLKPSNLFLAETLGERRTIKVLDFGVSKWLGPAPEFDTPLATGMHSFVGTPAYVSPEQLTRPDTVDERTDVWALGVVIHRCLSGELPFETESVPRLCAAILTAEPRALRPGVAPDGLREIVARCLKKAPEARYQNILELARALAPFAPPSERRSLELIERLRQRPTAGVEVKRASEPVVATTPAQQSTTAGFSQETRVSGASPTLRTQDRIGRRGISALLVGVAIVGVLVAMTATRRGETPAAGPSVVEPDRVEPTSVVAAKAPEPPPVSAAVAPSSPAPAPASASAAVAPAPAPAPLPRLPARRKTTKPDAPAPAASPRSVTAAPAAPPSAPPAPAPSPVPNAGSSDDFDRHIYRR